MVNGRRTAAIHVHNSLLDGVKSTKQLPTYLLDLHSLSAQEADSAISCVSMLQTLSPTFRVVAMGSSAMFQSTAALGWPFEHLMPPEHVSRLSEPRQFEAYRDARVEIVTINYSNVRVIRESSHELYVSAISRLIDRPDLMNLAVELADTRLAPDEAFTDIASAVRALREKSVVKIDGHEGSALITIDDCTSFDYFLCAINEDNQPFEYIRHKYSVPDSISIIKISFAEDSSLRFESFLYAEFARKLKSDLMVVMPSRTNAVLEYDVLQWVDLAVAPGRVPMEVVDEYAEGYRLLSSSSLLDWHSARRYSVARRISRNFAPE